MDITKEQFFKLLTEWAMANGILPAGDPVTDAQEDPLQDPREGDALTALGSPVDFRAILDEVFRNRQIGPRMAAMLRTAPTRLLYRTAATAPGSREDDILTFNRALVESDVKWFTQSYAGGTVVREARDLQGELIPGLLVMPSVNNMGAVSAAYAIQKANEWLRLRANLALSRDNAPEGGHTF